MRVTTSPDVRRSRAPLAVGVGAVLLAAGAAGAAGWWWAGPPADGGGTVPPDCPTTLASSVLATGRGGVSDRLVPVPLPQPRGPVAVRLCRYPTTGAALLSGAVLDPPRTAELAGVMNTPGPGAVTVTARPPDCAADGPVTLLLFRYTQGDPLVAEVGGGGCALVTTSARIERGRSDVVRLVDAAFG